MRRFQEILAAMPETSSASVVEAAIQQTLAAQGTVISTAQLSALNVSSDTILRRLDANRLHDAGIARES